MQPLAHDGLTDAQMYQLLVGSPRLAVLKGLEQLDRQFNVVADLSTDLAGGTVSRDNYADEHGDCTLRMLRRFDIGTRVRPYLRLTDGIVRARVNLGVYVPTTPKDLGGRTPRTYDVACRDLLSLLRRPVGHSVVISTGAFYLTEVRALLQSLGFPSLIDGSANGRPLPVERRWELTESGPTWLQVINDLLAAIGYRSLWFDEVGRPRSGPYLAPDDRPSEFTFHAQGPHSIVASRIEVEDETGDVPNVWRFFRRGHSNPVEGDGLYEFENQSGGPTSVNAVGRHVRVRYFDAADQAALEVQGNRAIASDLRRTRLYRVRTSPFPVAGHFDVYTLDSARIGRPVRVLGRSFRVDLGLGDTEHTWEEVA